MNNYKILIAAVFAASSMAMSAQTSLRERVVYDGDTGRGIANVSIMGKDFVVLSDSTGRYTLPKECKTVVLSHMNYTSYMVNLTDLPDSVALFSDSHRLGEVIVFGTPKENPLAELNKRLRLERTEAELSAANPNGNLLGLFKYLVPKKWRTSKKKRRKQQLDKVLQDY